MHRPPFCSHPPGDEAVGHLLVEHAVPHRADVVVDQRGDPVAMQVLVKRGIKFGPPELRLQRGGHLRWRTGSASVRGSTLAMGWGEGHTQGHSEAQKGGWEDLLKGGSPVKYKQNAAEDKAPEGVTENMQRRTGRKEGLQSFPGRTDVLCRSGPVKGQSSETGTTKGMARGGLRDTPSPRPRSISRRRRRRLVGRRCGPAHAGRRASTPSCPCSAPGSWRQRTCQSRPRPCRTPRPTTAWSRHTTPGPTGMENMGTFGVSTQ